MLNNDKRMNSSPFKLRKKPYDKLNDEIDSKTYNTFDLNRYQKKEFDDNNDFEIIDLNGYMSINQQFTDNEIMSNTIKERVQCISKIANDVKEVGEIFQEVSNLVQQQSVLIDDIEYNVSEASDNVDGANKELKKAIDNKIKRSCFDRYFLMILGLFLFFLLLIILLIIVL